MPLSKPLFHSPVDLALHVPLGREALQKAGREDLIGTARHCLVPPEGVKSAAEYAQIRREKKAREERREMRERKGSHPAKSKGDVRKNAKPSKSGKPSVKTKR